MNSESLRNISRRNLLSIAGTIGITSVSGCINSPDPVYSPPAEYSTNKRASTGISMDELLPLEGSLTMYSGRKESLVGDLFSVIQDKYPKFNLKIRYDTSTDLANQIRVEGSNTPADIFYTVSTGALGLLKNEGLTVPVNAEVINTGLEGFLDPEGHWIGTSGRIRCMAYNTNKIKDASILPKSIFDLPHVAELQGKIGWAPTYGSHQDFITCMRYLHGREKTLSWLKDMKSAGVKDYSKEGNVTEAVLAGEIHIGLVNHYYPMRIKNNPLGQGYGSESNIELAFTENDAGCFMNVAGATIVKGPRQNYALSSNFIHHLLSIESQQFFSGNMKFEYPMVPGVESDSRLPNLSDLKTPKINLIEFAAQDINATILLQEDAGVL
jgi:iron(III) transport system substrate-binding protein